MKLHLASCRHFSEAQRSQFQSRCFLIVSKITSAKTSRELLTFVWTIKPNFLHFSNLLKNYYYQVKHCEVVLLNIHFQNIHGIWSIIQRDSVKIVVWFVILNRNCLSSSAMLQNEPLWIFSLLTNWFANLKKCVILCETVLRVKSVMFRLPCKSYPVL